MEYLYRLGLVPLITRAKIYSWFILHKLGLARDAQHIMQYAFSFLSSWRVDMIDFLVQDFLHSTLQHHLYREGKELIAEHDPTTNHLILLSNAFENLAIPAAEHLGIPTAFGTQLEHCEGRFTGKIGASLFGTGKAQRTREYAEDHDLSFHGSWAYGDSISDLPLLELVDNPVVVNPDRKLYKVACERTWRVIRFNE